MPVQVIGQLNMKRFVEDYAKAGITVSVFSESDKALAWLESQ
jgi:pyridoxine 5'-phosphate synthase PdxJ